MHCLRWWLPIFLLPLPAASPFLLILFIVLYAIQTKPCAYCSMIILGLMFSTCSFYHDVLTPLKTGDVLSPTQSLTANEAGAAISAQAAAAAAAATNPVASPSMVQESIPSSTPLPSEDASQQRRKRPSSCWIDLTHTSYVHPENQSSKVNLGWWSAPTWRKYPSVLSRSTILDDDFRSNDSLWSRLLHNGLFVGLNDVGFRLQFSLE